MASIICGEFLQPLSCDLHRTFCPLWDKLHRDTQESEEQVNQASKGLLTRKIRGRMNFYLSAADAGQALNRAGDFQSSPERSQPQTLPVPQ